MPRRDGTLSLSYIDREEFLSMGAKRDRLAGECAPAAVDALNLESITGPSLTCQAALSGGGKDVRMVPVRLSVHIPLHVREHGASASPAPSKGEAMLTPTEQEAIQVKKDQLKAQIALKLQQLSEEKGMTGQASQRASARKLLRAEEKRKEDEEKRSKTIECKMQGPTLMNVLLDPTFMIPRKHLGPQPTARPPPKVSFIA